MSHHFAPSCPLAVNNSKSFFRKEGRRYSPLVLQVVLEGMVQLMLLLQKLVVLALHKEHLRPSLPQSLDREHARQRL